MFTEILPIFNYEDNTPGREILSRLLANQFLESLDHFRSKEQSYLTGLLADTGFISLAEAEVVSRQITREVQLFLDAAGTGKIVVGKQPYEKRYVFFFERGQSTGLRKIFLPQPLLRSESMGKASLPKKTKVLFINLKSPGYPLITAPLGIITLGGYLERVYDNQVEIDYLDMQLEQPGAVYARAKEFCPDILGMSVKIGAAQEMAETLENLATIELDSRPIIVLGNVIPTYASDELHHLFRNIVCVTGRGENAIKFLVNHVALNKGTNLSDVPNSTFVQGSTIYQVGGIPFPLSELGMPHWESLFSKYGWKNYQEIWIEASRGCPQKKSGVGCSFCAIMPNNDSRDWVSRPTQAVLDEVKLLSHIGVPHIRFADEEFMAGQTIQALELAKALKQLREELHGQGVHMPTFDLAVRVDDVHKRGVQEDQKRWNTGEMTLLSNNEVRRRALITFREAGLTQLYLGLESGSFNQLKRMYKAVKPEDNQIALAVARELGIQVAGGWIMIDPLMEGLDDLKENMVFLEENNLIPENPRDDFVTSSVNRMRILEGSALVDVLRREGLLGQRQPSLAEYDFRYKDPRIAKIAQMLDHWEDEIQPFFYALKNKVAVETLSEQRIVQLSYLSGRLFFLKKLDFEFLKETVHAFEEYSPHIPPFEISSAIEEKFRARRRQIISKLLQGLINGVVEDDAGTLMAGLRQIRIPQEQVELFTYCWEQQV